MPAVEESRVYTRPPSLAADCVKTWKLHAVHVTATRPAQTAELYDNHIPGGYTNFREK